jgi:hypothetical protein
MKLAIMQPYFFPYIGYFSLIASSDKFIIFDITQYTPKSWMNRNRILHPTKSWQYITVPLSNSSISIKISEAKILDKEKAKKKIVGQLDHYHSKAPFFKNVIKLVEKTFDDTKTDLLVELNKNSIKNSCDYLGLKFDFQICSKENFSLPDIVHPGRWALEISSLLKAKEYINPPSGKDIFIPEEFKERGIKLSFLEMPQIKYECSPYEFIENLSIIDVMMWNSPEKILKMIEVGSL